MRSLHKRGGDIRDDRSSLAGLPRYGRLRFCRRSNERGRSYPTTFLVILIGFAVLSGLIFGGFSPISAQGTFQNQRDPTACDPIGNIETTCQDAFSSDNVYALNSAWYQPDWRFRKKITINSTRVVASANNFPVLIILMDADLRDKTQNDGDDIVFTADDGVTKLAHEIEAFNGTSGELVAWVNVTRLSATADTVMYMYYGNGPIGNQQDPQNVWDDRYKGVWHLKESPAGTTDEIRDSTSNVNHGATAGSMDSNDLVNAKIGQGLEFDGSDDLVNVTDSASLDGTNDEGTFELWIKWNNTADGDWQIVMTSSNRFSAPDDGYEWASQGDGDHYFYPWGGDGGNYNLGPNPFTNGSWHHLAVTLRDSGAREVDIYVDGVPMSFTSENVPARWTTLASPDHWLWGGNPDIPTRYFDGVFDEIRVSDVVRPTGWIETEYNNQNDPSTFYQVGVEERPTSDAAWKNLGFNFNATDTIERVEIGVEWFRDNAAPILNLTISWDGGSTWAANQTAATRSTDDNTLRFLDFTSAVFWTPLTLEDSVLRARAGTNASGAYLDHIVVRVTFTTVSPPGGQGGAPQVITLEATSITEDTAVLRGSLPDLGSATGVQVSFEWGLSPALSRQTPSVTLQTPATFQTTLEELDAGSTYYFRANATGNGTAIGETLTFQTAPTSFAGDIFLQLLLWLILAAIAAVMGYLLTRKHADARRRQSVDGSFLPARGEVAASAGAFTENVGLFHRLVGRRRGTVHVGPEAPLVASTTREGICPYCGTPAEREAVRCFGCGERLSEGDDLTKRVRHPNVPLVENERGQEALVNEMLNSLEEAATEASTEMVGGGGPAGPGNCLYCGTALENETGNCPECGRSVLDQGDTLEETVRRALETLELDENDTEALFTLGSYLLLDGKAREALETLNRLTLLDPNYPGQWRLKALVFEKLGNKKAAKSALAQARRRNVALGEDNE